jgi:hypothetical protein
MEQRAAAIALAITVGVKYSWMSPNVSGTRSLGIFFLTASIERPPQPEYCGQHREVLQRELARLLGQHELHRLQVRLGAPDLALQVGRHLHQRRSPWCWTGRARAPRG